MDIHNYNNNQNDEANKQSCSLVDLSGFKRLEKILESFSKLCKFSIHAVDDKIIPVTKIFSVNIFCSKMLNLPDTSAICSKIHAMGLKEAIAIKDRITYICPYHLLETVIPIFNNNECVGAIICGQAKCNNYPPGFVEMVKNDLPSYSESNENNSTIKLFYDSIPVTDFNYYDNIISILNEVTSSFISNKQQILSSELDSKNTALHTTENKVYLKSLKKSGLNLFFLLNAVNSLANLSILDRSEKINSLSILLARHIKSIINNANRVYNHLEEEKNNIIRYLSIQKIRFGELLNFTVSVPANIRDYLIPVDIILPFIERIFVLNYSTNLHKFHIGVFFKKDHDEIVIEITDNFTNESSKTSERQNDPYNPDPEIKVIEKRILNSKERLNSLFNNGANIYIKSKENDGSRCLIRYPAIMKEVGDS